LSTRWTKSSALRVLIYDKSREVKVSGKHEWMTQMWAAKESYTADLPVYRAEFQFFRKALRELRRQDPETGQLSGINTIADLRSGVGDLVRYVVGGKGRRAWFRVASPDSRDRRTELRGGAPWWQELARAFLEGMPETGRTRLSAASSSRSFRTTCRAFVAWAVKLAAQARLYGLNPGDSPEEFLGPFARQYLAGALEAKGRSSFEEAVSLEENEIRSSGAPPCP